MNVVNVDYALRHGWRVLEQSRSSCRGAIIYQSTVKPIVCTINPRPTDFSRFNELAEVYINEYPSTSFSLRYFGQHLSTFLKKYSVYRQQLYLSEIAEFEWQLIDVFDLADTPIANLDDIAKIEAEDWPGLTIELHASVSAKSNLKNTI